MRGYHYKVLFKSLTCRNLTMGNVKRKEEELCRDEISSLAASYFDR